VPEHSINYRPYQIEGRDATFREFDAGIPSTLVVMPTGTGKTVLGGMMIEEAKKRSKRSLFIAHRRTLIKQAVKTFAEGFGFSTYIEMGDHDALEMTALNGTSDVVVGSIQSLQADRLLRWSPNEFGLIIIDEAHHALADSYSKTLNWFRDYWLAGITATPKRGDRRNLGSRFTTKAYEYGLRQAISDGYLVKPIVRRCPVPIDLRGIKIIGGDFSIGELEERIGPRIETLARHFLDEVGDRRWVAFTPDVGSAMAFAQVCTAIGVADGTGRVARYVAGAGGAFGMHEKLRDLNLTEYEQRQYQGIVCCELLVEGWDDRSVEAVGVIRATTQAYRYGQMIGRGLRICPEIGKTNCLIIDFDWQTDDDARDICSTVDLFDDGLLDPDVYATAKQLASERAVDIDAMDVIEEAERIERIRRRFSIKLTGKTAKYESYEYDPIGLSKILGIKLSGKHDIDRRGNNPASEAQLGMLKRLGVTAPESMSKWGASKLIGKLLKRRDTGMASPSQVKELIVSGVNEEYARALNASEASGVISDLRSIGPKRQREFFS
jgi:superfamily II DNA or RNA helicase